eukprot:1195260-Prorocentrum_minimum.AAC.3
MSADALPLEMQSLVRFPLKSGVKFERAWLTFVHSPATHFRSLTCGSLSFTLRSGGGDAQVRGGVRARIAHFRSLTCGSLSFTLRSGGGDVQVRGGVQARIAHMRSLTCGSLSFAHLRLTFVHSPQRRWRCPSPGWSSSARGRRLPWMPPPSAPSFSKSTRRRCPRGGLRLRALAQKHLTGRGRLDLPAAKRGALRPVHHPYRDLIAIVTRLVTENINSPVRYLRIRRRCPRPREAGPPSCQARGLAPCRLPPLPGSPSSDTEPLTLLSFVVRSKSIGLEGLDSAARTALLAREQGTRKLQRLQSRTYHMGEIEEICRAEQKAGEMNNNKWDWRSRWKTLAPLKRVLELSRTSNGSNGPAEWMPEKPRLERQNSFLPDSVSMAMASGS